MSWLKDSNLFLTPEEVEIKQSKKVNAAWKTVRAAGVEGEVHIILEDSVVAVRCDPTVEISTDGGKTWKFYGREKQGETHV
jgi:hypothetical protein